MEGLATFFEMGGHGFYIWGSYGVALVIVLVETFLVMKRHRKAKRDLALMEQDVLRSKTQGN